MVGNLALLMENVLKIGKDLKQFKKIENESGLIITGYD